MFTVDKRSVHGWRPNIMPLSYSCASISLYGADLMQFVEISLYLGHGCLVVSLDTVKPDSDTRRISISWRK